MGLDMYLYRDTYVQWWDHMPESEHYEVVLKLAGKEVKLTNPSLLREHVAYWCKANHIHAWFVANVQGGKDDCGEYWVTKAHLAELVRLCKEVLASEGKDYNLTAARLLPTQSGFFFGPTVYDEWYYQDLRDTLAQIEPLLAEEQWAKSHFYYHSSW